MDLRVRAAVTPLRPELRGELPPQLGVRLGGGRPEVERVVLAHLGAVAGDLERAAGASSGIVDEELPVP